MTLILRQTPINCPKCGEFLWRNFRETYDMTLRLTEQKEGEPLCKNCNKRSYFDAIKHAEKIETLKEPVTTYENPEAYGDKIVDKVDRKPSNAQRLESDEA